jgi:hypothetical protein
MSDFGELCPLFDTGVFSEVVFPSPIGISLVGTLKNLLLGTQQVSNDLGAFTFGRTVVVTEAFIRRQLTNVNTETTMYLKHQLCATIAATTTIFASCTLAVSGSQHQPPGYKPFAAFTGKTFESNDVLCLAVLSGADDSGNIGLMVRYREK